MTRILAALAVTATLALTACGGPSEEEKYVDAVNARQAQVGRFVAERSGDVSPASTKDQVRATLVVQAGLFDAFGRDLTNGTVKVPESLKEENAALADAVRDYAAHINQILDGDQKTWAESVSSETDLAQQRIKAVLDEINAGVN